MAAIVPARTSGYISDIGADTTTSFPGPGKGPGNEVADTSVHSCSQVFVENVLLLFKSIHRLILGIDLRRQTL